jgi:hypothetical protein
MKSRLPQVPRHATIAIGSSIIAVACDDSREGHHAIRATPHPQRQRGFP